MVSFVWYQPGEVPYFARAGWMGCDVIFLGKAYAQYAIADAVPRMTRDDGMIRLDPTKTLQCWRIYTIYFR